MLNFPGCGKFGFTARLIAPVYRVQVADGVVNIMLSRENTLMPTFCRTHKGIDWTKISDSIFSILFDSIWWWYNCPRHCMIPSDACFFVPNTGSHAAYKSASWSSSQKFLFCFSLPSSNLSTLVVVAWGSVAQSRLQWGVFMCPSSAASFLWQKENGKTCPLWDVFLLIP